MFCILGESLQIPEYHLVPQSLQVCLWYQVLLTSQIIHSQRYVRVVYLYQLMQSWQCICFKIDITFAIWLIFHCRYMYLSFILIICIKKGLWYCQRKKYIKINSDKKEYVPEFDFDLLHIYSLTPVHGEVYLIQHYVIKFVSD